MSTNNKCNVIISAVWLCLVCVIEISSQTPGLHFVQIILRSHLRYWTINKSTSPETRCLLTAANNKTFSVTCDRKYNATDVKKILERLTLYKKHIYNLDLTCSMTYPERDSQHKRCACLLVYFDRNQTANGGSRQPLKSQILRFGYCSYEPILTRDILSGYHELRVLEINNNDIKEIEEGAFRDFQTSLQVLNMTGLSLKEDGIPTGLLCDMTNLTFVILNNFKYAVNQFPTAMFACTGDNSKGLPRLVGVFANGNQFNSLPPAMLASGAKIIYVLNLTDNGITKISKDAFVNMTLLQELNLDNNKLTTLPKGLFDSLPSLLYLSLSKNKLTVLNMVTFQPLRSLQELAINENRLHTIYGSFGVLRRLTTVRLERNAFKAINASMFDKCATLQILKMGENNISFIHSEAFVPATFLSTLDLGGNQLHNSTNLRQSLDRLEFIQTLNLSHNQLTELLPRQFHQQPFATRLKILNLSNNRINFVAEDSFSGLWQLYLLVLNFNRIREFKQKTFIHLSRLKMLWMDKNELMNIPDDAIPAGVIWLSLSFNRISSFPHTSTKQATQNIYMGYNKITHLNRTMLKNFENLTLLNLTHCDIRDLEEGTFEDLKSLEALDLSGNKLNLNFSINYLGNIFKVSYLNLSHNRIESAENLFMHHMKYANFLDVSSNPLREFPDQPKTQLFDKISLPNRAQIGYLYLSNCSLEHVSMHAFELMPNLVYLDLSNNRLRRLDKLVIEQENNNRYFVYLYGNPLRCDCHMSWLVEPPYNFYYEVSECWLDVSDRLVPINSLQKDDFLCRQITNCFVEPDTCKCFTRNTTAATIWYVQCLNTNLTSVPTNIPKSVRILDLRGNNFSQPSFDHLPSRMSTIELYLSSCKIRRLAAKAFSKFYLLELLDLSFNQITELRTDVFLGLYKLKTLHFHNNAIHKIEPYAFRSLFNLEILTLHSNKLNTIDNRTMAELTGLVYLKNMTLHHNPWHCLCDNATFKRWLINQSHVIEDLLDVQCNGTSVINLADDNFICYNRFPGTKYSTVTVVIVSTIAAVLFIVLVMFVVWYHNRYLFFVLLYHKVGWRWKQKEDEGCSYDAFIAYSNDSSARDFVTTELLPRLEPLYKLFISDRDGRLGETHSGQIIQTIRQSKRTIFLLYPDSFSDGYLLFTFQEAFNHSLDSDNHHRLIVIISDVAVFTERYEELETHLQTFIKAKQYITLTDKYFWQKLMYCLPDPPRSQNDTDECLSTSRV